MSQKYSMYLKEMNHEDKDKEYEFISSLKSENGFENPYRFVKYTMFDSCIEDRIKCSKGIDLREGYVPETYFFLWDNNEIIGLFKVRHFLNNLLKQCAGHIGYCVKEEYRRKGYAKAGLKLAIEELKKMSDFEGDEVYLACDKTNEASLKTMLACGGYIHHSNNVHHFVRIKV